MKVIKRFVISLPMDNVHCKITRKKKSNKKKRRIEYKAQIKKKSKAYFMLIDFFSYFI